MKKLVIFVILVCLPVVFSENFDEYKDLTLDFEIKSGLNALSDSGAKLDFIKADLKLIPVENDRQEIIDLKITSNPEAKLETLRNSVLYMWEDLYNRYEYGLKSRVKIKNEIVQVKSKIRFPQEAGSSLDKYSVATEFIDLNEDIKDKANEILEGETDYYKAVHKLSDWVKRNIEYDLNTITAKAVKKSSWVLDNREGVCDELTNLFISMLRSVGIPARFVTGMVYTNIEDNWGNHGWAEVYFPEIGWIPWDVTYGQFGYIDASHIKLSDTADSGESSVDYQWRSLNVEVGVDKLDLKTTLVSRGEKFGDLVKLEIGSVEEKIGFGGYMPIKVVVENLGDFYLSDNIILTKGPKVDDNIRTVLLKPREIKTIYWVSEVPKSLDSKFVYTSVLEVRDSFASSDSAEVFYSEDGEKFSFEEANKFVSDAEGREDKDFFVDVGIDCDFEDKKYYSNENIYLKCRFFNSGSSKLDNLNFCLDEDCSVDSLGIGAGKTIEFDLVAKENAIVMVESNDLLRSKNIKFDVIDVPTIYITEISPGLQ